MPATCPYNIPVVALPPQQVNGFSWGPPIRPLSRDEGKNWTHLHTFPEPVISLLVVGQHLYVGLAWSDHMQPSGVFKSNLGAGNPAFHAFGPGHTGLIVWTLAHDPVSGELYAGTEIFDHPKPYHPPFFRSNNGGVTWANVAGTLPWHVIRAAVRPTDGYVYALTEGAGLFGSADKGTTWLPPSPADSPSICLLIHPKKPKHLIGGKQKTGPVGGGVLLSKDEGKAFSSIGLGPVTVSGVAVNGSATRLYAVAYASGIYTSPIPASA